MRRVTSAQAPLFPRSKRGARVLLILRKVPGDVLMDIVPSVRVKDGEGVSGEVVVMVSQSLVFRPRLRAFSLARGRRALRP